MICVRKEGSSLFDYLSLFSPNQQARPRLMALAGALLSQVEDLQHLIQSAFPEARDPETAVGSSLDALGGLTGVSRPAGASDEDYRLLLRARIALNHWDGTNETLPEVLEQAVPGRNARVVDHLDGTVSVSVSGELPFPLETLIPVPAGIRIDPET